jgi:hypothetical protein
MLNEVKSGMGGGGSTPGGVAPPRTTFWGARGTSVLNRLQQDKALQEGSTWLKELQPYMRRMMGNYQLRVEGNSTSMRAEIDAGNLPLTERLLQPYWDCSCENVFFIFYPPMGLLDGDWKDALRLPVGGDFSKGSETGYSIAAAAFCKHRDWVLQAPRLGSTCSPCTP